MSANQACLAIAAMARVLGASKAGYHAWLRRPPSAHAVADETLLKRVRTVHASSRQTYGAPRVHADLQAHGERHGRKRIARLMRQAGLVGASHRHGGPTTTRRDKDARPAPNLVDRDFTASGPNQLWVAVHHLCADSDRVPVSGRGAGRVEPQDRRRVDGQPPAGRAGVGRNGYGGRTASAKGRHS